MRGVTANPTFHHSGQQKEERNHIREVEQAPSLPLCLQPLEAWGKT